MSNTEQINNGFICAICYTNGEKTGIVSPKCCSHKICVGCYTNIIIIKGENAQCPECRVVYVPKSEIIVQKEPNYFNYNTYIQTNTILNTEYNTEYNNTHTWVLANSRYNFYSFD